MAEISYKKLWYSDSAYCAGQIGHKILIGTSYLLQILFIKIRSIYREDDNVENMLF